eukprot:5824962-Alexandrium_andersonii.AAC.1
MTLSIKSECFAPLQAITSHDERRGSKDAQWGAILLDGRPIAARRVRAHGVTVAEEVRWGVLRTLM